MAPRFPVRVPRDHIDNLPPMNQDDLDAARKEFPDEILPSRALEKYAREHWIQGRYFWKDGFRYVCGSGMFIFQSNLHSTSKQYTMIPHVDQSHCRYSILYRPYS